MFYILRDTIIIYKLLIHDLLAVCQTDNLLSMFVQHLWSSVIEMTEHHFVYDALNVNDYIQVLYIKLHDYKL